MNEVTFSTLNVDIYRKVTPNTHPFFFYNSYDAGRTVQALLCIIHSHISSVESENDRSRRSRPVTKLSRSTAVTTPKTMCFKLGEPSAKSETEVERKRKALSAGLAR